MAKSPPQARGSLGFLNNYILLQQRPLVVTSSGRRRHCSNESNTYIMLSWLCLLVFHLLLYRSKCGVVVLDIFSISNSITLHLLSFFILFILCRGGFTLPFSFYLNSSIAYDDTWNDEVSFMGSIWFLVCRCGCLWQDRFEQNS